jgi:hypothetical protein
MQAGYTCSKMYIKHNISIMERKKKSGAAPDVVPVYAGTQS